jgi:hypothetical protein
MHMCTAASLLFRLHAVLLQLLARGVPLVPPAGPLREDLH